MMADRPHLTKDQNDRIEATLKRIRAGLRRDNVPPFEEPAHLFKPGATDDEK